jgi:hypothetical protein
MKTVSARLDIKGLESVDYFDFGCRVNELYPQLYTKFLLSPNSLLTFSYTRRLEHGYNST